MYAKIENGKIVEYPLYEGDLQNRFPEKNFPLDTYNEPVPEGYVRINPPKPITDINIKLRYIEAEPYMDFDGLWYQQIVGVPYTNEELESVRSVFSKNIRDLRDTKLKQSDWTQLKDIPENISLAWAEYRAKLRTLTESPDFPFDVVWPEEPK